MRTAFGHPHLQPCFRGQHFQHADGCGPREAAIKANAALDPCQLALLGTARDFRFIGALDSVARMHQPVSEFAIIGQQKQPTRRQIEAADRKYARAPFWQQVADRVSTFRVPQGGDHAAGLVQEDVRRGFGAQGRSVQGDAIDPGPHPATQIVDPRPVDRDSALPDELFGGATGRNARPREHLLEALSC